MRILLTGAFGNLGSLVLEQLLSDGHTVTAFDVPNKINQKIADRLTNSKQLIVAWGDIRNETQIKALVKKQDAVIHLAAVIAPFSENNPELAYAVNVTGTEYILDTIKQAERPPLLVFSSSISVFGTRSKNAPPCKPDDEVMASDNYSSHKLACEQQIRQLTSPWVILRLAGMVDSRMRHSDPQQARLAFTLAADNPLEYVHPRDAATAIVNSLSRPEAHHKIHLIGGGPGCQVTHLQLLQATMGAIGISISEKDLGHDRIYAHWLDSSESQQLLSFQRHTVEDYKRECYEKFRYVRPFVRPFSPLIKKAMKLYLKV
jgi:nucleoside-diphosphate-sugar epimerase